MLGIFHPKNNFSLDFHGAFSWDPWKKSHEDTFFSLNENLKNRFKREKKHWFDQLREPTSRDARKQSPTKDLWNHAWCSALMQNSPKSSRESRKWSRSVARTQLKPWDELWLWFTTAWTYPVILDWFYDRQKAARTVSRWWWIAGCTSISFRIPVVFAKCWVLELSVRVPGLLKKVRDS